MKLGKLAPRHDSRTLLLASYLEPNLPKPPPARDWSETMLPDFGMMLNDEIGDCTVAAGGHAVQVWTWNADGPKREITINNQAIVRAYSAITGYDPRTGANDTGAVVLDVLRYWRRRGIGGHKIGAYVALEPGNHNHVRIACELFGGVYLGLALPLSAQDQDLWSVPPAGLIGPGEPGSWGGHAVWMTGYSPISWNIITWGARKRMTPGFWRAYCDEAYAMISVDWLNDANKSPAGFDMQALLRDLNALR